MAGDMTHVDPDAAADMKWCFEVFWEARMAAVFASEAPRSHNMPNLEQCSLAVH